MTTVYIYEGEAERIARWTREFESLETGGELLMQYLPSGAAVVHLATGPGPGARRTATSFFQDADYLRTVCLRAWELHALQHGGSWHSHHTLALAEPSTGDSQTVVRAIEDLGLASFLLVIANLADEYGRPSRRGTPGLGAYRYLRHGGADHTALGWSVLPGESPVRCDPRLARLLPEPRIASAQVRLTTRPEVPASRQAPRVHPDSWVHTEMGLQTLQVALRRLGELGTARMFPTTDGKLELRVEVACGTWSFVFTNRIDEGRVTAWITPPKSVGSKSFPLVRPLDGLFADVEVLVRRGNHQFAARERRRLAEAVQKEAVETTVPFVDQDPAPALEASDAPRDPAPESAPVAPADPEGVEAREPPSCAQLAAPGTEVLELAPSDVTEDSSVDPGAALSLEVAEQDLRNINECELLPAPLEAEGVTPLVPASEPSVESPVGEATETDGASSAGACLAAAASEPLLSESPDLEGAPGCGGSEPAREPATTPLDPPAWQGHPLLGWRAPFGVRLSLPWRPR